MKKIITLLLAFVSLKSFSQAQCGTQGVSSITTNSASLSYSAAANNNHATIYLDYSTVSNFSTSFIYTLSTISGNATVNAVYPLSGLAPNTTYYWRIRLSNNSICNGTTFTTFGTQSKPTIQFNSVTPISSSCLVSFAVKSNNAATTPSVKYGTSINSLNQISGSATVQATAANLFQNVNNQIIGLAPLTKYYFQIKASNSAGADSTAIDSFTTSNINYALINEFRFDNTRSDVNNSATFTGTGSFATDRFGNANSAIAINSNSTVNDSVNISNLPQGAAARSFSFWVKRTNNSTNISYPIYYGRNANYQAYAIGMSTAKATIFMWHPTSNDPFANSTSNNANWYHYVVTTSLDGIHKLYVNGTLVLTTAQVTLNTVGTVLNIGRYTFVGALDDLKIFSGVLDQDAVTSLYNTNTVPLPTKITKFTLAPKNNINNLIWISENETNVAHFNIEYSTTGKDFEKVGVVSAGKKEYSFAHHYSTKNDIQYYRLQVVDKDGKYAFSNVVKVKQAIKSLEAEIYPTIVKDVVTINITSKNKTNATVTVVDLNGKLVSQKSIQINEGINTNTIELNKAAKGMYIVKVNTTSEHIIQKIVKQ